jgi:hypothetical protein
MAVYAVKAAVCRGVPGCTCHTPAKRLHCTINNLFTPYLERNIRRAGSVRLVHHLSRSMAHVRYRLCCHARAHPWRNGLWHEDRSSRRCTGYLSARCFTTHARHFDSSGLYLFSSWQHSSWAMRKPCSGGDSSGTMQTPRHTRNSGPAARQWSWAQRER